MLWEGFWGEWVRKMSWLGPALRPLPAPPPPSPKQESVVGGLEGLDTVETGQKGSPHTGNTGRPACAWVAPPTLARRAWTYLKS